MIIVRKENFGGIIFNTENAHEIWIGKNFFEAIKNFTKSSQQNKFQNKEILKHLGIKKISQKDIKTFFLPEQQNNFEFQILSSPTIADIHITNQCNLNCPHCYINSDRNGRHMSMENFELALDECKKAGVLQIAIGGGEPTLHPYLPVFLKKIKQAGIVPNLTTNAKILNWKTVYFISRYCGAVGLSIEGIFNKFEERRGFKFNDFTKSIKKLKAAGINITFQVTLGERNLNHIPQILEHIIKFKPYGVLFLAYKPAGRGLCYDKPISQADQSLVKITIESIFQNLKGKTKIGFDCCLTPSIIKTRNSSSFTGCTASRTSIAIMSDLRVMPCSFLNHNEYEDNLKNKSLLDIWNGKNFKNFRQNIRKQSNQEKCLNCNQKNICLGGCPKFNLAGC